MTSGCTNKATGAAAAPRKRPQIGNQAAALWRRFGAAPRPSVFGAAFLRPSAFLAAFLRGFLRGGFSGGRSPALRRPRPAASAPSAPSRPRAAPSSGCACSRRRGPGIAARCRRTASRPARRRAAGDRRGGAPASESLLPSVISGSTTRRSSLAFGSVVRIRLLAQQRRRHVAHQRLAMGAVARKLAA